MNCARRFTNGGDKADTTQQKTRTLNELDATKEHVGTRVCNNVMLSGGKDCNGMLMVERKGSCTASRSANLPNVDVKRIRYSDNRREHQARDGGHGKRC